MSSKPDIRERLQRCIEHLEHVLPGQAPIKDFVHHNTLHGYQHLSFPEALKAARETTGIYGYPPVEQFRTYFREGRIERTDLLAVLDQTPDLQADQVAFESDDGPVPRREVYLAALIHPLKPVTTCQFTWQVEERYALRCLHDDAAKEPRQRLLETAARHGQNSEAAAVEDLWAACLECLDLTHFLMHPEELTDLSPEQADAMLKLLADEQEEQGEALRVHVQARKEAERLIPQLLNRAGRDLTLAGILQAVTGHDLMDEVRPLLVRQLAAYLDQGMAPWHGAGTRLGFYAFWRANADRDPGWVLEDLPEWRDVLESLPDDPLDALIVQLSRLGLAEDRWEGYLERLALELPGWSGMFLWRHLNPGYEGLEPARIDILDYLAVRLALERTFAQRLCREQWRIEANLDVLRWYFRRRRSEFFVRHYLHNARLPEYLITLAQRQHQRSQAAPDDYAPWKQVADMIWTWNRSPAAHRPGAYSVYRSAWPLFLLVQHLGICGAELRRLNAEQITELFACLERLDDERRGFIWLQAYERHYRDRLFNAVVANHGRGRWQQRPQRPAAQVLFCMDDREEGIRRHLEEINPRIETLGAAGFFGVAINWRGLDDETVTPLCPVVVTPAHGIDETPQPGQERLRDTHAQRRSRRLGIQSLLHEELRRSLVSGAGMVALAAPGALLHLIGKLLMPLRIGRFWQAKRDDFDLGVPTALTLNAGSDAEATPEVPRLGFTDTEQADRVQGFLRTVGLTDGFGPLVVMMGHGSGSQNNPHLAAYDCGACSGRHGGPNARVFAAMANRPEIRAMLAERGIQIPDDCWFLGAEHNTCDESIVWYDTGAIPECLTDAFHQLRDELTAASRSSAQERCRRLASAPKSPGPDQALAHIAGRAYDFSQARPELGHATNAAAFIGRRSLSQGAFFDRRVFLISYDPSRDPEGEVVEAILLAAGPVGAGISLEYYFSTANNEGYGCGTKVTHNVNGLLGVMEGASSDLRTGLPRQMIEIHEAMRLQILVEAKTEILTRIYQRQPVLQELVGNGWVLLSAKDPDSEAIHCFDPAKGWVTWTSDMPPPPTVARSADWYDGHHGPLAPALLEQKAAHA